MLDSTYSELLKPNKSPEFLPKTVTPEQAVLLERKVFRAGRFDFLVESSDGKFVGVEVLTRPSKGKLKKKLAYAKQVDEFIFVLPERSLGLYRKKQKNGLKLFSREKFLPKEFASKKIFVWLFDRETKSFLSKSQFSLEFNTALG